MNYLCPLFTNKDVFDKFNNMISSLGGRPMTEDEFRSADLRMQRTGLDLSAVEAAYRVFALNNGHFLEEAPNGRPSILFASLLQRTNNNYSEAIRQKANAYSDDFFEKFGDWTEGSADTTKIQLDINGEPLIADLLNKQSDDKMPKVDNATSQSLFGKIIGAQLDSGMFSDTSECIASILKNNNMSQENIPLAEILKMHSIPIVYGVNEDGAIAKTVYDNEKGSIIVLDPQKMQGLSNAYIGDILLHEVVHSVLESALVRPETKYERSFKTQNEKLFSFYDKVFSADRYNRSGILYGLTNEREFAAEFATNRDFRNALYLKAREIDKQSNGRIGGIFKRMINALTQLFVNDKVFKNNVDKLDEYSNRFNDYLLNKNRIIDGDLSTNSGLYKLYKSLSNTTISNEQYFEYRTQLNRQIQQLNSDNFIHLNNPANEQSEENAINRIQDVATNCADYLTLSLKALMSSRMPNLYKSTQKQILESQIQMFQLGYKTAYTAISQLLIQIQPQLIKEYQTLSNIYNEGKKISSDMYMYQYHDRFGTYARIFDDISKILESNEIKQILASQTNQSGTSQEAAVKEILRLHQQIKTCRDVVTSAQNCLEQLLTRNIKSTMTKVGEDVHDVTMGEYLSQLEKITGDTSAFFTTVGSIDRAKDNSLRVLFHLVNDAINKADIATFDKSVDLLNLKKGLSLTESVADLYEHDKNGKTTGYLVRDINFGQFEQDYNDFLRGYDKKSMFGKTEHVKGLNEIISEKYGILLETSNKQAPANNDEARKEWLMLQNDWLDKHCERRFKKEYYQYYNELSETTRNARSEIQSQIEAIKSMCLGEDGFYHFDNLSEENYKTLQTLYTQKRLLASDYNIVGQLKEENSEEYKIAKELQKLNERIKPSLSQAKKNKDAWMAAREKVIESAGGREEYEKYLRGEKNAFKSDVLQKWDNYNSKKVFKTDSDGKVLLFKHIDEELGHELIYAIDGDNGAQYNTLKKKQTTLLNDYRDYVTGDVRWNAVPKQIRSEIEKLDVELSRIRKKAIDQNPELKELVKKRAELYEKYVDSVPSLVWQQMRDSALQMAAESNDFDLYDYFLDATYVLTMDYEGQIMRTNRLKKQFSKLVAKPEYEDEYMELQPGNGYIEADENNDFVNPEFQNLKKYNKKWVPKRSLYDNSAQYNKIMKSKGLSALYKGVLDTMEQSNSKYTNREHVDNYLLPQITGSFFKRLKNQRGKFRQAWEYIKDGVGYGEQGVLNDYEFGADSNNNLSVLDDMGNQLETQISSQDVLLSGMRPDGRALNLIPQYYTKKMDDPGHLSADLIGIVCEYYNKALQFENKNAIQADCESIVDMLGNRTVKKTSITAKGVRKKEISGELSNTYKAASKFLEMNLYNKRKQLNHIQIKGKSINLGKFASVARALGTAINLGCSFSVAAVGAFSTAISHIVQSITGQHYGMREAFNAGMQAIYDLITTSPFTLAGTIAGSMIMNPLLGVPIGLFAGSIADLKILRRGLIQNRYTNNLTMARMEMFNIGDQGTRKYKNSNRIEAVNVVNDNWCYGMLTFADFITKSQIMNSTLMSYRFYKGEFCTKEDLKINFINKPLSEYKKALKEWHKGVSIFSLQEIKNGYVVIKDKYKQYEKAYNQVLPVLHARIQKYSASADGMQTSTQKSAITQNALGAFVMMHRQYLPTMLQERWSHETWDYDTQQMSGGIFRSALRWGTTRDLISAAWCAAIDAFTHMSLEKGHETYNKKLYGDNASATDILNKTYSEYKLKQIGAEVALTIIAIPTMVSILESILDDNDKRKDKMLNMLLYIAYRSMWESKTPYLFSDLSNNIKTVTAETSVTDKVQNLLDSGLRTYLPQSNSLLDTFLTEHKSKEYETNVKRGSYKGWSKVNRDLFKLTPFHNTYEQYYGGKDKLKYFKNQVVKDN